MDHLLSVGMGEFLEVRTFWLMEPVAEPEDLGRWIASNSLHTEFACRYLTPTNELRGWPELRKRPSGRA
jgi:hypothetical protein